NPVNPFLKQKSVSIGEICGSETPPQSNLVNPVNPVQKPESVKICEICGFNPQNRPVGENRRFFGLRLKKRTHLAHLRLTGAEKSGVIWGHA
ncbi:MAG: hypothetical protein AAGK14_13990, partial [Verrucomicrobiota bacterium]